MAKIKLGLEDSFKDLLYRVEKVQGNLRPAVDEALTELQKAIQSDVQAAAAKYAPGGTKYSTGKMLGAIKPTNGPEWAGTTAKVGVGFEIHKPGGGGMHSVWMMYGTPRIAKDSKLYKAVRGAHIKHMANRIFTQTLNKYARL